ncbi:hypothetical protein BZA77DRAFT_391973 [Pyronema omphalodes]|nr:hypothetical protein BZA77DRAFT_391973 [Pyronema omphalodes]
MMIKNCEIMSGTSSAVLLQLDESRQQMEKTAKTLEDLSVPMPPDLQQKMSDISDIKTLVSELAEFNTREVHNMSLGISDVQRRLQDDEIRQIRPLISPLEPHKRHHDIRQNRLEGTGTWFLQESAFQRWRDSESEDENISSILACSGVPGAGKSVICSLVIDHLEERFSSDNRVCVAFLYCDYQNDEIQTPVNMVGVLLNQVIAKLNDSGFLPPDTMDKLKQHLNEHKNFGLAEVCELFRKAVKQLRTFYICIDALDECKEETREDFIHALADIANECSQSRPIRIFFTTRPNIRWQELMERNSGLGSLDHFVVQAHLEDVRKYILHQIGRDGNPKCMNDRLKDEILERITETCDRMFLLPALQIQTVLGQTTISKRRKALYTMPVKLETAFKSTISRIQNQDSERSRQAMDVLKWTFLAQRPLSVEELRHALSVDLDLSKMRPGYLPIAHDETLDLDNLPSEESLIDWCLGLIVIDEETSTIRLVHKSLHDYLTELDGLGKIFPNGHTEIALTCLQYMRFNDYNTR